MVIVPIYKNEEQLQKITSHASSLVKELKKGISVKFDDDDNKKPGKICRI